MRNLVTGANGFVGAAVVRTLLANDETVRALVRVNSDTTNLDELVVDNGGSLEIVHGDITDDQSMLGALDACDCVFHVAADYRLWARDPRAMYQTNVDGSVNVLDCAARAGVGKMVYTSSVAVLGTNADRTPANEDTPVSIADMVGPYKRSKFLAEEAVRRRAGEIGFPIVIVNPSTPIGPGDIKPTPTGRIIVDAALGRMPAYVDTGLNLVHVDDVARGHLHARDTGRVGERYILGGDDKSLKEILSLIAMQTNRSPPRIRLARPVVYPFAVASELVATVFGGEPRVTRDGLRMSKKTMYFSSQKAVNELGYRWSDPEQAIADALAWFKRHAYIN